MSIITIMTDHPTLVGTTINAHPHPHAAEKASARVTWKSLITLGIAGGMLPCPSAIVVMISAIALGKVLFGMLLIVAFSLGLASVLTAIGVALVLGKRLSGRSRLARVVDRPGFARLGTRAPGPQRSRGDPRWHWSDDYRPEPGAGALGRGGRP